MATDVVGAVIGLGVAAGLIASVAAYARMVDRRRTRAYVEHCLPRGLRFEHDRPGEEARHAASCRLFSEGHGRSWRYTISGERGNVRFTAFEYQWTTGSGESSHTHTIAAVMWSVERPLPLFMLTPEDLKAKLAALFGGEDIDFADSPEFSRRYRLRGSAEDQVRALFTADLRRALTHNPNQHVAGAGHELFWWRTGRLPSPEGLDQFLVEADRIRRLFDHSA